MSENKTTLDEFVTKLFRIEGEQKLLSEDRKLLIAEYKDKLDVKSVQAAVRIVKIKSKLDSSDEELDNLINAVSKNVSL
jgi:uncharacterized protein (UPF0335 family)